MLHGDLRKFWINKNDTPLTVCHFYWQGLVDEFRTCSTETKAEALQASLGADAR